MNKMLYLFREGDLRVIRPFVYVREKDLRLFAEKVLQNFIPKFLCKAEVFGVYRILNR